MKTDVNGRKRKKADEKRMKTDENAIKRAKIYENGRKRMKTVKDV